MSALTINRAELVEVTDAASAGLTESSRARWRRVAQTTDAVAVGWFHCDGVRCPARQAARHNQAFQEAFDRAMAERFGREFDDGDKGSLPFAPFVVLVTG